MSEKFLGMIDALRDCGREFVDAAKPILEDQRFKAKVNLHDPVADEVICGLFSRIFRFLQTFVLDYHMWAEDMGRAVLRMMLESLFYLKFLLKQNQHELFVDFQTYGIGQEKLYKMQLRKLLEEGKLVDSRNLREFIDSDSDEEISDELINVRLKNFENLREVATEAGMKDDYVLYYQPDSIVVHGHWPALRRYYLVPCAEPLHRHHRQSTFELPQLDPQLLRIAFGIFERGYELWITRYGLDDRISPLVENYFKCCSSDTQSNSAATPADPAHKD